MKTYLCIDIEATCHDRELLGRDQTIHDMETIDLGVVAVDPDGNELSTFQSLIKPRYTELTDYCTDITGITSAQLSGAPTLPEVMGDLARWLATLPAKPNCLYSWGKFDAKQLTFDTGSERWHIDLPLPEHHNAKKLFQKRHIKKGKQVGLMKALELVGLEFKGRHHSALDDARNVARLLRYFTSDQA